MTDPDLRVMGHVVFMVNIRKIKNVSKTFRTQIIESCDRYFLACITKVSTLITKVQPRLAMRTHRRATTWELKARLTLFPPIEFGVTPSSSWGDTGLPTETYNCYPWPTSFTQWSRGLAMRGQVLINLLKEGKIIRITQVESDGETKIRTSLLC